MLCVNDLSICAGKVELVHHVSFSVAAGESLALMGASGSGKSLTAMACMGLLAPNLRQTSGKIVVGSGQDATASMHEHEKKRPMGLLPALIMQNPADCFDPLFPIRSVFVETFGAAVCCTTPNIGGMGQESFMEDLLQQVGFAAPRDILACYPFELSGGMLHRVMIALALGAVLCHKVPCVIADEPLSGLDMPSKVQILTLIRTLQQKYGFSLLYIDHDVNAARAVAQNLAIMHEGFLVDQGSFVTLSNHEQSQQQKSAEVHKQDSTAQVVAQGIQEDSRCGPLSAPGQKCLKGQENAGRHHATKALMAAAVRLGHDYTPIMAKDAFKKDTPLLEVCAVHKGYGAKKILENVTFALHEGQNIGVVGSNGAGKSTLSRLILGLEEADAGEITYCGQKITKDFQNPPWRQHVQVMFQHARLAVNPRLSVTEVLREPLHAQGRWQCLSSAARRQKIEELLTWVELPVSFAQKYPAHMSGGQLQRLCLARALALEPRLVILDEPLADVDVVVAEHLQKMLGRLQQELQMSFLYISHDITSVLRFCSHILVLDGGQVQDFFPSHEATMPQRSVAFKSLLQANFVSL